MPNFEYVGKQNGKAAKGVVSAANRAGAISQLKSQKIVVTKVTQKKDDTNGGTDPEIKTFMGMQVASDKLSDVEVMMFSKKLETMMKADLPIMDALQLTRRQAKKPGMIKITNSLIADLNQGQTFSSGLEKFPQYFDDSYVNMIKAGESSGTLSKFLNKIVTLVEKKMKIVKDIKGALTYPVNMSFLILSIASLIKIFVVTLLLISRASIIGTPASNRFDNTIASFA